MSWWDSIKANIDYGLQSVNNTYNNMISFPTDSQCPTCQTVTAVPPEAFNWVCFNNHTNNGMATICHLCPVTKQEVRSRGLYNPRITCTNCHRLNDLYETKAMNWASTQVQNAPDNAARLANTVKESVVTLASAPTTFHCTHCSTELGLPMGPWTCSACSFANPEQTVTCTNSPCNHSRYADPIICGVCHQHTAIPQLKVTDHLQKFGMQVSNVSRAGYLKLWSQEPYCSCVTCNTPIILTKEQFDYVIAPNDNQPPNQPQQPQQQPQSASLYPSIPNDLNQQQQYQPVGPDGKPLQTRSVSVSCPKCQQTTVVSQQNLVYKQGKSPQQQAPASQQPQQAPTQQQPQQQQPQPQPAQANPYASTAPYQTTAATAQGGTNSQPNSYGYPKTDEKREKLLDEDCPPDYSN